MTDATIRRYKGYMLHQIIDIQNSGNYLYLERGFLKIKSPANEIHSVPLDDIASVIVSATGCTFSKNIIDELANRGVITVICDKKYTPSAIVYPVCGNYQHAGILRLQLDASVPLKKQLWKTVVENKLKNQSAVLTIANSLKAIDIEVLSKNVKSGDIDNKEAQGARIYWTQLFGKTFTRNQDMQGINSLLNYGYAIMRASMCRAISASGLLPALGIHHCNTTNSFALADDLFEIYRPIVDCMVYCIVKDDLTADYELTPEIKKFLTQCVWIKVKTTEGESPAFQSMQYYVASFIKSLRSKKLELQIPQWEGNIERVPGIK